MFASGYTKLFQLRRIPVRAHWSVAIGLLWFAGGRHFSVGAALAYALLILVHELGHALLVRRYGLSVYEINLHGLGGECVHEPTYDAFRDSVIAWGGVLAQVPLALFAVLVPWSVPELPGFLREAVHVWLWPNLFLVVLNLLPLPGFDGAEAWRLGGLVRNRVRRRKKRKGTRRNALKRSDAPVIEQASKLHLVRSEDGDFRFEVHDDSEAPRRK